MYLKSGLGQLEVITGPMFSGKTEELLKRINILK
ncbi:thymidine kinase, partial [Mycoplasma bovis]|nr:thymidine kinase [Mycoplasmopsis bovis]MBT1400657.1 thymidine kinase [Mycoplasmopsis bovis]